MESAIKLLNLLFLPLLLFVASCGGGGDVSLYVALDESHSRSLIERFEQETGLAVKARFDDEASKTVGLVSALIEESRAGRPRCDVFWNNELAHTVRLSQLGFLEQYRSPSAAGIPASFRDEAGYWTGFAARARVLIVNTELIPDPEDYPTSMWDLTRPEWKGKCGIARPLTGTTLTHFAALHSVLGEEKLDQWINAMTANGVEYLQSNGATMRAVRDGRLAFAFTDTDDYHVALSKGAPVACVFPDQGDEEVGTMLIPNSVAIVKDCPHPAAARKLVDWILREETEALLAQSKSAQIPVRASVPKSPEPSILNIGDFRVMSWDAAAVANSLPELAEKFGRQFGM